MYYVYLNIEQLIFIILLNGIHTSSTGRGRCDTTVGTYKLQASALPYLASCTPLLYCVWRLNPNRLTLYLSHLHTTGAVYTGGWKDDLRQGVGVFEEGNGQKYAFDLKIDAS